MLDLVNAKQVLNTLGLGEITGIIPLQGGNSPFIASRRARALLWS
jgi:hypothetical protein